MSNHDVDIIITWVDGNDPLWREEKEKYEKKKLKENNKNVRYRDWDNIQYIFRGIEKFMPWVNKVHFVTWGHLPTWLKTENKKLNIVNHKDFIPHQYLPTFNSNAIELNFFRIKNLSEKFIYFNDDMFVIAPTQKKDFFYKGLPRDLAALSPQPIIRGVMPDIEINNLSVINDHFSISDIKKNKSKWFDLKYGSLLIRTLLFINFKTIIGIYEPHIPLSYLKSTFEELWNIEQQELDSTCSNKFRTKYDVNQWLMRQWQLMKGMFIPRNKKFGVYTSLSDDIDSILEWIKKKRDTKLICLNDTEDVKDFDMVKSKVNCYLDSILPEKSSFEI